MKLKTIIAIALLLLFFNGCSQKELIVEKTVYVCTEQKILDKIEHLPVYVSKNYLADYEEKREMLYEQIDFYIEQVKANNKMCEKYKKENKQ